MIKSLEESLQLSCLTALMGTSVREGMEPFFEEAVRGSGVMRTLSARIS